MTHTTLFSLGTPFGQWPSLARSFLDERLLDPAIATWHEEVVCAPLPEVNGANVLDALVSVKIDRAMLERLQSQRPTQSPCWGGCDVRLSWTGQAVAQLPHAKFLIWVEHPASPLAHWLPTAGEADAAAALAVIESSVLGMVDLVHRHRSRCLVVYADEAAANPDALARQLKEWLGVDPRRVALPAPQAMDPLYQLLSEQLVASSPRLLRDYERLYASCVPLAETEQASASRSAPLALEAIKVQSRSREDLAKAQRDSEHLSAELRRAQQGLEQAFQKQQQDKAAIAASHAKDEAASREAATHVQQLSADLQRQVQESELMLVQLHQVQEELEHYYRAYRNLQASPSARGASPMAKKTASVEIGIARDTPPHRELNLVIHGLQVDQKKLGRLHARLVEHHGRPGLALLQPGKEPAPLAVWEPSGSEGELSFVLLIPSDDYGRQRLQRMGASDWRVVEAVIRCIEGGLDGRSTSASSYHWVNVAQRLSRQIAELPERFRFDRVAAAPDPQAAGAFLAMFGNVSFGSRYMAQVQARWWPQTASVELLRPDNGDGPMPSNWPVDHAGKWVAAWPLPLGGAPHDALSAAWRGMSRFDREFLFGLLDALPAATYGLQGAATGHADEMVPAAAKPLRAAYRLFHGGRLRRVVQAVRGRIAT